MHHTSARRVIEWLLEGTGFDRRGLTLTAASCLGDASIEAVRLRDLALQLSAALTSENPPASTSTVHGASLPGNEPQFCQQFCAVIIAQPAQIGFKLACLGALVRLWPHVGADERTRLRSRLLDSFAAIQAPADSQVSTDTLKEWQRNQPTCHGEILELQPADLRNILDLTNPAEVYAAISDRLLQGNDLSKLFRVVSTLAIRLRLNHRDHLGWLHHTVLGAIAGEELAKHIPAEHMATMLVQLVHELWWCRHHAGLELLTTQGTDPGFGLTSAVVSGDQILARRAARAASKQSEIFWNESWDIMEHLLNKETPGWPEALTMLVAIAWRTGNNVIAPDDAGLLGMVFAEPACRDEKNLLV